MRVVIKGAGDLASGVAARLYRAGLPPVMTDIAQPTAIRRTVSFCMAIPQGAAMVEDVKAVRAHSVPQAVRLLEQGVIPVLVDEAAAVVREWKPHVVVDAILAKRNINTSMDDAPIVIGMGPGFTAGVDCHAVIETMRGHDLGRVIYQGSALPDTRTPGVLYGYAQARLLRAPGPGIFQGINKIGDRVRQGQTVAMVGDRPVVSEIDGLLRGLLMDGLPAHKGMKIGDVDPGGADTNCATVSDKARSLGGAVLEAILHLARERGLAL